MNCKIISIGDEILMGDTLNTNASWLGCFFTKCGVDVIAVQTIRDRAEAIREAIRSSMQTADLVITTGGLGPTHDDITKQIVAEFFGVELETHHPTLIRIKKMLQQRNIPVSDSNIAQAQVPENADILPNSEGTAPGLWFERDGRMLAVLPGIPREMKALICAEVGPRVVRATSDPSRVFSHYIKVAGIGESTLSDEVIGSLDDFLTDSISVAYLPSPLQNTIRLSVRAESKSLARQKSKQLLNHIRDRAGKFIIGEGEKCTLSSALGTVLRDRGRSISVAESCTGGLLGSTITDVPGSSDYFAGGVLSYANRIKINQLGVPKQSIATHGAVSKHVALAMARAVATKLETDAGLATTGIAGPNGGSAEKPVGTVWVGFWSKNTHFALCTRFSQNRKLNKKRSVALALEMARRSLLHIKSMPYGLKPRFA